MPAMTPRQKRLAVISVIAGLAGLGFFEAHTIGHQREHIAVLESENGRLRAERTAALAEAAATDALLARVDDTLTALAREETGRDPAMEADFRAWAEQMKRLRIWADRLPHLKIPEMRYLTARDWLVAALDQPIETEQDARQALSSLRGTAKTHFAPQVHAALGRYRETHGGADPTTFAELLPFFPSTTPPEILARYEILTPDPSNPSRAHWFIAEKTLTDDEYDTRIFFQKNGGTGLQSASRSLDQFRQALESYRRDHDGKAPSRSNDLLRYFPTPPDAALQKHLERLDQSSGRP